MLKRWMPRSIYLRFFFTVVLIGVLPVAATGLTVVWINQNSLIAQSSREMTSLAQGIVGQVETYMTDILAQSRVIAALSETTGGEPQAQRDLLNTTFLQYNSFSRLSLYHPDGRLITSSNPQASDLDPTISEFARTAKTGAQTWQLLRSNTYHLEVSVFTAVRPDAGGPPIVLQSVIQLSMIAAIIGNEALTDSGNAFIINENGTILVHPDLSFIGTQADSQILTNIGNFPPAGPGSLTYAERDEAHIAGYAYSTDLGWLVLVDRPEYIVLTPVIRASQITLSLLTISIVLAITVSFFVTRHLTKPLQQLAEVARDFGHGEIHTPLPTLRYADNEISSLIGAFGEMRSAVSEALEGERTERMLNQIILTSVPSSLLVVTPDLRVRSANQAAFDLFGGEHTVLIGATISELLRTNRLSTRMEEVLNSGAAQRNILFQQHLRERERLLRVAISPVQRGNNRSLTWLLVTVEDLTELVEVQQRNTELVALQAISQVVLASDALPELLEAILVQTINVVEANWGCITLLQTEHSPAFQICSNPSDEQYHVLHGQMQQRVIDQLLEKGGSQAVIVDPLYVRSITKVGTIVGIPIHVANAPIGVIIICTKQNRWFQPHELHLLETIGGHVGLAVQKHNLYDEVYAAYHNLRQAQNTLTLQYAITQILTSDLPEEEVLEEAMLKLAGTFLCSGAQLALYNQHGRLRPITLWKHPTRPSTLHSAKILDVLVSGEPTCIISCPVPLLAGTTSGALASVVFSIVNQGRTIGAVELVGSPELATEHEMRTLSGIADQIGLFLERRRAQADLRESEERFRQIAEQISDVFWLLDPKEHKLLYLSPAYETIWGRTRTGLNQQPFRVLRSILREDRNEISQAFRTICQQPQTLEHRVVRPDGSVRWILSRSVPVRNERNEVYRVVGSCEDITARRVAEDAVRQANTELASANAELARAVRLKDEFLATMSHELRTPLNAILGRAEVLSEEIHGPLNERQQRGIRSIEESGRHLLSLINDILDLSKIEANKLDIHSEPVVVSALINAAVRMVSQTALSKQISIQVEINPSSGVLIGDERRLKQVLVNLLSNAVKFTPKGGSVGVEVQPQPQLGRLDIVIWDTGIGISSEDMSRLFRPFVQLDSRLAREHGGTGLGLALVAKMTAMHGGSVSVESSLGEGSSFTISLPWESNHKQNGHEEFSAPPPYERTLQIVLAHGDPPSKLVSELERYGCILTTVRSGIEVVSVCRHGQPDLLLLDRQMPQADGLNLLGELRNHIDLGGLPIVLISSLVLPDDPQRCLSAGAQAYLIQPFSMSELYTQLITAINASRKVLR